MSPNYNNDAITTHFRGGEDVAETVINIGVDHAEIDEHPESNNGGHRKTKKRISLNPSKVIGGISQSANVVKGGISQSANAVKGGISQSANAVKGGISQMENGLNDVSGKLTKVPGISQGVSIFADYRKFLDRGNVIDLAVAVVIGAAFTGIVESLVKDIVSPILALASGRALEENFVVLRRNESFPNPDYSTRAAVKASDALSWNYGNFIQTVINFFIISACVFLIVKLYQMGRNTTVAVSEKKCPFCSGSIDLKAVRCSRCTSWLNLDAYAKTEIQLARKLVEGPTSVVPQTDGHVQKEEYSAHDGVYRYDV